MYTVASSPCSEDGDPVGVLENGNDINKTAYDKMCLEVRVMVNDKLNLGEKSKQYEEKGATVGK